MSPHSETLRFSFVSSLFILQKRVSLPNVPMRQIQILVNLPPSGNQLPRLELVLFSVLPPEFY